MVEQSYPDKKTIYGLVLAGGLSKRLGSDKYRLIYKRQTLLERAISTLEKVHGLQQVLVSGHIDSIESIPDFYKKCGPLGGIHAGIKNVFGKMEKESFILLIIPVDMPMLTSEVLQNLIITLGKSNAIHYEGEIFPCLIKVTQPLYRQITEILSNIDATPDKLSMRNFLASLNSKSLKKPKDAGSLFFNLNTKLDLEWLNTREIQTRKVEKCNIEKEM